NTLAIVQSITSQTLRRATDVAAARTAIVGRIQSFAQAHDILTMHNWQGADLADVVARAVEPFGPARIDIAGGGVQVSPKHVLALSLALYELGTNAAKYGALSNPAGRIALQWRADGGLLRLSWQETGGPAVTPPTHRGFGSRLLE